MKFGSLFSGAGGLDLGLEQAGHECVFQVEINDYCRQVLARHWPHVPKWNDVRTFPPAGDWGCDLIAGGFPCTDISNAGKQAGIEGEHSGLWGEFIRIVRVVRPRYVLVENVAALRVRGLDRVLGDLAQSGFDAEWDCIPAAAVGAPHRRDRLFIVAYPHGAGLEIGEGIFGNARQELAAVKRSCSTGSGIWATEPGVLRVADGIPDRVERIRALGNAVVPAVAKLIGQRMRELLGD